MILLKKQVAAKLLIGVAVVGGALSPVIASAQATDTTTVNATVNSAISVSSTGTVAISVTPDADGAIGTGTDTVEVDSNDVDGYTLTLKNDADTAMNGPDVPVIAATTGTLAEPTALTANTWGFRVDNLGTFGSGGTSTYAAVGATDTEIRSTTATANAEQTLVQYAVNVDLSLPDGLYTDTVTYTATVK